MGRLPGTLWMRALLLFWFVFLICSRSLGLGVFRRGTHTGAALAFRARRPDDAKTKTEETVVF